MHVYPPDDLLVGGDFEEWGAIGYAFVDEPVADYGIAVWEAVDAADPVEFYVGQILLSEMPDDFIVGIDFDDAVTIADYRVAVAQSCCAEGEVGDFYFSYQLGGGIVFSDDLIVEEACEVVAVWQFSCVAHSHVCVWRGFDGDNLYDLSFAIDLDQAIGGALGDERISVFQPLATPYLAGGGVLPDYFFIRCDLSSAAFFAGEAHEDIAVF